MLYIRKITRQEHSRPYSPRRELPHYHNVFSLAIRLDHEDLFDSRSRIFVASHIGSTPKDSIRI